MKSILFLFVVAASAMFPTAAQAQREINSREILVEGTRGDRSPAREGRDPSARGGSDGEGGSRREDRGYPPPNSLYPPPMSGIEPGVTQYSDGSYDVISIDRRAGTYTIDRFDRGGRRVGGESGSTSGYVQSGPPHYMVPPVTYGRVCYTPSGPFVVQQMMVIGQPCYALTPWGTFYGTAGQ